MTRRDEQDVIIIGAGLAGLTAALELADRGYRPLVLEGRDVVGGRTSSWTEDGMPVESGFHRMIGYYRRLPALLRRAGVDVEKIVMWEKTTEIRSAWKKTQATFGVAPFRAPGKAIGGIFGNGQALPAKAMRSLVPFFVSGLKDYLLHPEELDRMSVQDYALKHRVHPDAFHFILIPLTEGLFFLPPERYSAYVFFGLLAPAVPRIRSMKVGAYLGGMTEVMADPLAQAIRRKGGRILTGAKAESLIVRDARVCGARSGGREYTARETVVATALGSARRLIRDSGIRHPWLAPMMALPTMPSVTFQMDLDSPALPADRATFAPGTSLSSFTEQSRTTFRQTPGRLSAILGPADSFIRMPPEQIMEIVLRDAYAVGLDLAPQLRRWRIVRWPEDFHSLAPGHDHLRPGQETPIAGLTLAGDYTRQPFFATMEGAVVSGERAAGVAVRRLRKK